MSAPAIAVCGLDCTACGFHGSQCAGCAAVQGRVFWAEPSGLPGCPIYDCAAGKGHASCGQCSNVPCALWASTREPGIPDDKWDAGIAQRLENLGKPHS